MPGLDDWLTAAESADPDELRERILTGFLTGKPFTPYVPTLTTRSCCAHEPARRAAGVENDG